MVPVSSGGEKYSRRDRGVSSLRLALPGEEFTEEKVGLTCSQCWHKGHGETGKGSCHTPRVRALGPPEPLLSSRSLPLSARTLLAVGISW